MSKSIDKITRVILMYLYYSLKVLGCTNATINFTTLEVTISHSSVAYCVILNVFAIGTIPFISQSADSIEYINRRILATVILFTSTFITVIAIIATMFLQLINRDQVASLLRRYMKLVPCVITLTTRDFYNMQFLLLVILKMWCPYNYLLCSVCVMVMVKLGELPNFMFSIIMSGILLQIFASGINSFYMALLYLWRMNQLLDEELSKTLSELRDNKKPSMQKCCDISDAIDTIANFKSNLYNLCVEVQGIYRLQKIVSVVYYFSEVTSKWFLFYSLMITVEQKNTFLVLLIFYGLLFLFYEVFLLIYVSDLVIRIPTADQNNLHRESLQIEATEERLERSVSKHLTYYLIITI